MPGIAGRAVDLKAEEVELHPRGERPRRRHARPRHGREPARRVHVVALLAARRARRVLGRRRGRRRHRYDLGHLEMNRGRVLGVGDLSVKRDLL